MDEWDVFVEKCLLCLRCSVCRCLIRGSRAVGGGWRDVQVAQPHGLALSDGQILYTTLVRCWKRDRGGHAASRAIADALTPRCMVSALRVTLVPRPNRRRTAERIRPWSPRFLPHRAYLLVRQAAAGCGDARYLWLSTIANFMPHCSGKAAKLPVLSQDRRAC